MKRILTAAIAALALASTAFGASFAPVQLLNPAGSTAGQAIVSTGPSSAPAWGSVSTAALTGIVPIANGGTGAATATAAQTNLGLGTAATYAVGTSGATVPLLSTANTWTLAQTFTVRPTFNGATPVDSANVTTYTTGRLLNVQVFTSSGTYTPTAGQGHAIIDVQCAGGGSGGTATTSTAQAAVTAGGGSGGFARVFVGTLGSNAVTIGAGGTAGTGGASPTAGGTGGTTSFGSLISCTGGGGSSAGAAQANTNFYLGGGLGGAGPAPTISGGVTILNMAGAQSQLRPMLMGSTANPMGGTGANSMLGQGGFQSAGTPASPTGYGAAAGGGAIGASTTGAAGAVGGGAYIAVYEYQ